MNLFFYGTLKRRHIRDLVLGPLSKKVTFYKEATLQGYALYNLGHYPGVKRSNKHNCNGHIYKIDEGLEQQAVESIFNCLDGYESVPHLYLRDYATCVTKGDREELHSCVVYVYNGIPDGEPRLEWY